MHHMHSHALTKSHVGVLNVKSVSTRWVRDNSSFLSYLLYVGPFTELKAVCQVAVPSNSSTLVHFPATHLLNQIDRTGVHRVTNNVKNSVGAFTELNRVLYLQAVNFLIAFVIKSTFSLDDLHIKCRSDCKSFHD